MLPSSKNNIHLCAVAASPWGLSVSPKKKQHYFLPGILWILHISLRLLVYFSNEIRAAFSLQIAQTIERTLIDRKKAAQLSPPVPSFNSQRPPHQMWFLHNIYLCQISLLKRDENNGNWYPVVNLYAWDMYTIKWYTNHSSQYLFSFRNGKEKENEWKKKKKKTRENDYCFGMDPAVRRYVRITIWPGINKIYEHRADIK